MNLYEFQKNFKWPATPNETARKSDCLYVQQCSKDAIWRSLALMNGWFSIAVTQSTNRGWFLVPISTYIYTKYILYIIHAHYVIVNGLSEWYEWSMFKKPLCQFESEVKIQIQPVCLPLEEPFNSDRTTKKQNNTICPHMSVRSLKSRLCFLIFHCSPGTIHKEEAVALHSVLPVVIVNFLSQEKCENP